jgi:hypothetical protein
MTVAVEELRELKSDLVVDARATSCPWQSPREATPNVRDARHARPEHAP